MVKPGLVLHPWEYLEDALEVKGWSQVKLAEIIGISKYEVNDIIKWRRNITPRIASRLWEALGTSWSAWLKLQNLYDLYILDKNEEELLEREHIRERVKQCEPVLA